MKQNYSAYIQRMIDKYEGGYCWDAGDPGGPTKYGITCYDLAANRGQKMNSMSAWVPAVKAMTRAEAEDIYKKKYAAACKFDELPSGVDAVLLDYGINSGVARPPRVAAALLGFPATTVFTPALLAAVKAADPAVFINKVCDERLRFMHAIRNGTAWEIFGGGWGARVADLRKYSLALTKGALTSEAHDLSKIPTPKANNQDPNTNKNGGNIAGTGTTGAGTGWALADLPWEFAIGIVVISIIAASVYIYIKNRNADKADAAVSVPVGGL